MFLRANAFVKTNIIFVKTITKFVNLITNIGEMPQMLVDLDLQVFIRKRFCQNQYNYCQNHY